MTQAAEHLLSQLNDVQRSAVEHRDGPLVVFAGAGSGKTRIITSRIAYLIETGVPPWEILAVTFTNKAAGEMRERVAAYTAKAGRALISTFHSACARWLREFAAELGFTSDFSIYDDGDSLAAVKKIMKELNIKLDGEHTPSEYKAAINHVKTMAMLPSDPSLESSAGDLLPPAGLEIYRRYQEYLAECNAMDFGDLIMNVLLLLRRNERVRNIMQTRYRYIMVDEYQDTNRTQFELIARLAEKHRNLFVVGDDDQSIFSWRGAVPANILNFDKVYPDAKKITLEQNYRCSFNIVNAASIMVANNRKRVVKNLFTDNPPGDCINFRLEPDGEIEAWWVAETIVSERSRFDYHDVAVFYRTNSQSRSLEEAFRRENIPYRIFGTVRFYDRVEVKDLLAYMRLIVNPRDDMSLRRIVNVPTRGIGAKALADLEAEATRTGQGLFATLEGLVRDGTSKLGKKFEPFWSTMQKIKAEIAQSPLDEASEIILDHTDYLNYLRKKFPDQALDKIENVHELAAAVSDYHQRYPDDTLAEWLQVITLTSSEEESQGGVTMMTLHMAKGLEFPRVYIVGMEEGLLPHRNSLEDPDAIEEERRLFYVGMTRAKQRLSLAAAHRRRTYNQWMANQPSRFLREIPNEFFEASTHVPRPAATLTSHDDGLRYEYGETYRDTADIEVGRPVSHPTYGRGIVEEVVDEFGLTKVVVRFDEFGRRKVRAHHLSEAAL